MVMFSRRKVMSLDLPGLGDLGLHFKLSHLKILDSTRSFREAHCPH
jgi:hypothetical protein